MTDLNYKKKHLVRIQNSLIEDLFDLTIQNKTLVGEHELYCFYHDLDSNEKYGLVYSEYYENNNITQENISEIIKNDAKQLHQILKKTDIEYFFIMPYFNIKHPKISVLQEVITTKEI